MEQKNRLVVLAFLLILHSSLFILHSQAQIRFGYLSYSQTLQSMPDYSRAKTNLDALRKQFDAEMKRAEEEFNKKYEEFLEGMNDFAVSIRNKRQSELQELMEKNIAFKEEGRRLLAAAEAEAMEPLHWKLAAAVRLVGMERGLAFILNTDRNACPFINPSMGEDVSEAVISALSH